MIEVRELRKHYTMGRAVVRALDGIDLRIEDGESVALVGPSGSGKSTFLHLIGGLDTPSTGSIRVDGEELAGLGPERLARYRNEKVGFVFQGFHLQGHLSAAENVALPLKLRGVPKRERARLAAARLDEVGLSGRTEHRPAEMSGGECQRVAIARALAGEPRLILADEPTGNLDSRTGVAVFELFLRLRKERGLTLVVVTHNPEVAELLDRPLRMRDGKLEQAMPAEPAESQT